MKILNIPAWLDKILEKITTEKLMPVLPDQLIINEYLPGQGITDHIDCEPCFGDTILSISLGSSIGMNFTDTNTNEKIPLILNAKSAIILSDDVRYRWKHGIQSKKSDMINGMKILRGRRISLTFRKVIVA